MKRGINIHKGKEVNVLKSMKVQDIMRKSIELIQPQTSIDRLIQKFIESPHSYFYIVDGQGKITDRISQSELSAIAPEYENLRDIVVASDIGTPTILTVTENDNLDYVMKLMGRATVDEIPVVSSQNPGDILGSIWRVDVISAYNKEILKRDLAGEVSSSISHTHYRQMVEVMEGLFLLEIDVPHNFIGEKIITLDVRNRYGIDIVMIKNQISDGESLPQIPRGDYVFQKNDRLLILGEKKSVEFVSNL
jgi:CIC family chloride channel protein